MTSFQQIRRRRNRRRWVIAGVVIVVILGIAFAVTRAQSDQQSRREYLDVAFEVADASGDAAGRLIEVVTGLEQYQRPALVEILAGLDDEVESVTGKVAGTALPPGETMYRAHLLLEIAVNQWRDGIQGVQRGLLTLSETPQDEGGLSQLTDGLVALRVGDSAYRSFLASLEEVDTSSLASPLPEVAFVPEEHAGLYDTFSLAGRLVLTPLLSVVENLAVADVRLDPGPIGEEGGIRVVPVADRLDAEATIGNRGTVEALGVLIRLTLVGEDGTLYEDEGQIDLILPTALSTVVFEDLPMSPDTIYELTITLARADDDPSDDSESLIFKWNEEE